MKTDKIAKIIVTRGYNAICWAVASRMQTDMQLSNYQN